MAAPRKPRKPRKPAVKTPELAGMPAPSEEIEIVLTGKDTWVGYTPKHKDIKVGRSIQLMVVAHVTQVGVREASDGEDVPFVKIKAESIEES